MEIKTIRELMVNEPINTYDEKKWVSVNEYREMEVKLKNRIDRFHNTIDALESITNDWNDLCDCAKDDGVHSTDCMTMKARKDIQRLTVQRLTD